jgi:hypothetical protein
VLLHWPTLLEMLQKPKSRYCCTLVLAVTLLVGEAIDGETALMLC